MLFVAAILSVTMYSCDEGETGTTIPDELRDIVINLLIEDDTIYIGESIDFDLGQDTLAGKVDFAWTFEGGAPDASTETSPVVKYEKAGKYGVTLELTRKEDGKKFSDQLGEEEKIVVLDTAKASFTESVTEVIEGGKVTFVSGDLKSDKLAWTFEGGAPTNSDQNQVEVAYATAGVYDVTLVATLNKKDVTNVKEDLITVKPMAEIAAADITFVDGSTTIEQGTTVDFNGAISDGATISWSFGGLVGEDATSSTATPSRTYSTAGTYTVNLTVEKNGVSNVVAQKTIIVTPIVADIAESAMSLYQGQSKTFNKGSNTTSGATLQWYLGETPMGTGATQEITFEELGANIVKLEATKNGITVSESITVTVNAIPAANFVSAKASADGTMIYVDFDQELNDPSEETFAVMVGEGSATVNSIALKGDDASVVVLTLATPIAFGEAATVSFANSGNLFNKLDGIVNDIDPAAAVNVSAIPDPSGPTNILEIQGIDWNFENSGTGWSYQVGASGSNNSTASDVSFVTASDNSKIMKVSVASGLAGTFQSVVTTSSLGAISAGSYNLKLKFRLVGADAGVDPREIRIYVAEQSGFVQGPTGGQVHAYWTADASWQHGNWVEYNGTVNVANALTAGSIKFQMKLGVQTTPASFEFDYVELNPIN